MDILISIKRTKMAATRHISLPKNIPKCFAAGALPWTPLGKLREADFMAGLGGHFFADRGMEDEKKVEKEGNWRLRVEGEKSELAPKMVGWVCPPEMRFPPRHH